MVKENESGVYSGDLTAYRSDSMHLLNFRSADMDDPELEAVVKTWLETVYCPTVDGSTASFASRVHHADVVNFGEDQELWTDEQEHARRIGRSIVRGSQIALGLKAPSQSRLKA